jgi:hypothetical protein
VFGYFRLIATSVADDLTKQPTESTGAIVGCNDVRHEFGIGHVSLFADAG